MTAAKIRKGSKWKRFVWNLASPRWFSGESYGAMVVVAWGVLVLFGSWSYGRIPYVWVPMLLTACCATLYNWYMKHSLARHQDIYFYGFFCELLGPLLAFSFLTLGVYGLLVADSPATMALSFIPLSLSLYILFAQPLFFRVTDSELSVMYLFGKQIFPYDEITHMEVVEEDHSSLESIGKKIDRLYIYALGDRFVKLNMTDMPVKTCDEIMRLIERRSQRC